MDPATVGVPSSAIGKSLSLPSPMEPLEPVSEEELPPPNNLVIKAAKSSSDFTLSISSSVAPKPLR